MNNVNKTLYIPLYGKSYVSKKGLFIKDKKAEEIWTAEGFPLKGKSASKWLAYYMGVRSAVFDEWLIKQTADEKECIVIHIGCGLDSRILRVEGVNCKWYDVDFPEVISERCRYFKETPQYKMLEGDARDCNWLEKITESKKAVVVIEGVSMYMTSSELCCMMKKLSGHFEEISLLMDCYTTKSAKISKYKNPINDVGVTKVYGIDDPAVLNQSELVFVKEHTMTPEKYINELRGIEKFIFAKLYAGNFAKSLYRLFEYRKVK
ncbi:MAG: class I SAM-dependent methyltransferase [Ruminococcus sp.]|nr:class I SAM-dependent methyltransferase [Ruminococcus sp.]